MTIDIHSSPPFLADNIALDLLNTLAIIDGHEVDFLQTEHDAIDWLSKAGIADAAQFQQKKTRILPYMKEVRALLKEQLIALKDGRLPDIARLNHFLSECPLITEIYITADHQRVLRDRSIGSEPQSMLYPILKMTAELITREDLSLIKQCEHDDCILWFEDKTKSHKRRWCSMAVCGNRHKVAQFRKRKESATL
jgi:predicted RNA-binding Zn ribbon-like protein